MAANALHPHSKFVVILKLHKVLKDRLPLDVIANVRAIATEVSHAFYPSFITPIHHCTVLFITQLQADDRCAIQRLIPDLLGCTGDSRWPPLLCTVSGAQCVTASPLLPVLAVHVKRRSGTFSGSPYDRMGV